MGPERNESLIQIMYDKTRHIPFAAVPFSFATPVKNFFAALGLCAIVIAGLVPQQVQGQDTAEQTLLLLINDAGLSIERRESGQRSRASESGQNESAVDESAAEPLNRSGALASNHLRQSGTPGEFASMQKAIQAGISGRGSLREAVKQQRESAAYQQQRAVKNIAPRALWYASSGELLRVTRFVDPRVLRAPQRGIAFYHSLALISANKSGKTNATRGSRCL